MTSCERFETEAILRLEEDLPLDEHFASCPDCLAARAAYDRLRSEIAALGEGDELPVGWQAGVWRAVEERRERSRWWRLPWKLAPVGLAAALGLLLLVRVFEQKPVPVSLTAEVRAGENAVARRGAGAKPGDRLVLHATTGGARYVELRVYRNDAELVAHCSDQPPCVRQGDELQAALALDAVGVYKALLFTSRRPLPPASSDLDGDTGAAFSAGADVELGPEIVVR